MRTTDYSPGGTASSIRRAITLQRRESGLLSPTPVRAGERGHALAHDVPSPGARAVRLPSRTVADERGPVAGRGEGAAVGAVLRAQPERRLAQRVGGRQ